MSAWKPGDVAMVTVDYGRTTEGARDVICFRTPGWWRDSTNGNSYGSALGEVKAARPLVVIDPEDAGQVERLVRLLINAESLPLGEVGITQAALREFANPKPRCSAHGDPACTYCSRITSEHLTEDGGCTSCGTYATEGMHWDTCPGRLRGSVFASRDEAVKELRS